MKIDARSPDHYFEQLGPMRRDQVVALRERIRSTWPQVKEDLVMGMPTYHLDGQAVFALADQKNYLCLYVLPYDLLDAFRNELKAYNHGRSCIRFRNMDEAALDLCSRIVRYVGAMHGESKLKQVARV
ncbi:MAG: DUF1801 domain-containing protein [Flavobacteriales bacterium]|nr:DUF1801 domain-containing protein [Flavobacteriales bacterium]